MATALETGLDWGTKIEASVVTYRFAKGGEAYDGLDAYDWLAYEIQQVEKAFALFETFLDITFVEVASGQQLTLVVADDDDMGRFLGFFFPPGEPNAGLGAFNWRGAGWEYTAPGSGALEQGGYGFVTIIHEFGHALGLAHPHDAGGSSTIFPGVTSAFGDYGDFDLNQGVYTTMSYNRGWDTNPNGGPASISPFGYQGTPMALDIAVLQAKYGANLTYRTGADTYVLPTSNAVGNYYSCIWDAGGIDAIVHDGSAAAVIDLRPATLQVEPGGGGFLSYVGAVFGGFTIAHGVVIENARGGSGGDTIFGNAAANVLEGRGGDDVINGLGGADTIDGGAGADTMRGGPGDDTYVVDNAGDIVDEGIAGSAGIDHVRASIGFSLADSVRAIGDVENLTLSGSGAIDGTGNALANLLVGNGAANVLDGRDGADIMRGGIGDDVLAGGRGRDSLAGGEDSDVFLFSVRPKKANADRVIDFVPGEDAIHLDHDAFGKLREGDFEKKWFYAAKNAKEAGDGNDRIVYDTESGKLRYDKDGKDGQKAKLFAVIEDGPNDLSHHDFLIVA